METNTGEIKAISNLGKTKNGKYYEKLNYAIEKLMNQDLLLRLFH